MSIFVEGLATERLDAAVGSLLLGAAAGDTLSAASPVAGLRALPGLALLAFALRVVRRP